MLWFYLSMERIEAIVSGRVQMVMYRDFAQRKARGLKLVGEVMNLPDGTVRVTAEGEHKKLERYIEKLHRGPLLANVENVAVSWSPAIGQYTKFSITYA
ncbi:MAG TPA: acylphosphatase [Candidatus Paceibacterota bacterium]|nr:acylphosphatase [Candidatus Paceibacterota bacterium]